MSIQEGSDGMLKLYTVRDVPESTQVLISKQARERGLKVGEFLTVLISDYMGKSERKPISDSDLALLDFFTTPKQITQRTKEN